MNNCPKCGSDKTMTKRMVHEQQTTITLSEGSNSGVSLSAAAAPTFALGTSRGKSFAQSTLAAKCAPPTNPHPPSAMWRGYFWIVGTIAFLIISSGVWFEQGFWGVFWAIVFALVAGGLYLLNCFSIEFHAERHNRAIQYYDNTWICLTCGHEWVKQSNIVANPLAAT